MVVRDSYGPYSDDEISVSVSFIPIDAGRVHLARRYARWHADGLAHDRTRDRGRIESVGNSGSRLPPQLMPGVRIRPPISSSGAWRRA